MLVGAQIYFTRFLSSTQTWVTFEAPLLYASGTQTVGTAASQGNVTIAVR
jgi:hypothetical protein